VEYTDEFENWFADLDEGEHAFDPRRVAILLLGGDKTIDNRWYDKAVPRADKIYDARTSKL